ncbi:MAG: hypothetical protein RL441_725 [Actinomycetota bacterium]
MAIRMKVVFTAVSVLTAAGAAAAINFQILATSGISPEGLDFAQLAPPAPEMQVVESADGTKTVIAYVTKTAAGEIVIKTLPAVTIYASSPGLPTADGGGTVSATGTPTATPTGGPTVEPIPTITAAGTVAATPTSTDTVTATPTSTDTAVPSQT